MHPAHIPDDMKTFKAVYRGRNTTLKVFCYDVKNSFLLF